MPTKTKTTPRSARARRPDTDRRRSPRVPSVIEAWLLPVGSEDRDQRLEIASMDLSRHGVGFCVYRELPLGTFHVVEIALGDQRLVADVRIVFCRPFEGEPGLFQIGAEFC
jgi:PilZ domain-containing protein